MNIKPIIYGLLFFFSNFLFAKESDNQECQSYISIIEKAKKEWPNDKGVVLSSTMRNSFVKHYNLTGRDSKELIVDEMMLFPLYNRNEWYVLGARNGCFVFWINLEPDKFVELIDGGSMAKELGIWKEDK